MKMDVYHPLVDSDHKATCAALCTNANDRPDTAASWNTLAGAQMVRSVMTTFRRSTQTSPWRRPDR